MQPPQSTPSPYERRALLQIEWWKERDMGWFEHATDRLGNALHEVTGLVRRVPGVAYAIDEVLTGVLRLINEITQDTVTWDGVQHRYRTSGHDVATPAELHRLDLKYVDAQLDGLTSRYRSLAAAEGAATGFAGASGIVPDVVALVAINLRAAGEHAALCGFDLTEPAERLFALQVLNAVTQPTDATKQAALVPVMRVARQVANDQAVHAIEQHALSRALRNAARALGIRLTKAKLAQVLPVVGAGIGAGFNAYYTSKVCDAAYYLYRERFLLAKYGPDVARAA